MSRPRLLLAVTAATAVAAPSAAGAQDEKLSVTLGDLRKTVLQAPAATNPFTGGDPCIDLGGGVVVAPLSGPEFTCTVKPGSKLFVVGIQLGVQHRRAAAVSWH